MYSTMIPAVLSFLWNEARDWPPVTQLSQGIRKRRYWKLIPPDVGRIKMQIFQSVDLAPWAGPMRNLETEVLLYTTLIFGCLPCQNNETYRFLGVCALWSSDDLFVRYIIKYMVSQIHRLLWPRAFWSWSLGVFRCLILQNGQTYILIPSLFGVHVFRFSNISFAKAIKHVDPYDYIIYFVLQKFHSPEE